MNSENDKLVRENRVAYANVLLRTIFEKDKPSDILYVNFINRSTFG